jgi:hypothetical protein
MKAELKRILCLQGYDMDMAYEISNLKEELEIYKGEELKFKLAQIATKKATDMSKPEQKIYVDDALFERCLADSNSSHTETAKRRGFIRARYMPYGYHTEEGIMYRHGIVNIINVQAKRNKIYEERISSYSLFSVLNDITKKGMRVMDISPYQNGDIKISYTQQRYIFD